MTQKAARVRNMHVILGTSVGLVVLVAFALGWLGWRLLAQEETLQKQQARSRLEQSADQLLARVLLRMSETDAALGQMGADVKAASLVAQQPDVILVSFSKSGVQVQGQLLYQPTTPMPESFDPALFAESQRLQFQAKDFAAAASLLEPLAASKDGQVRAEALFSLARVQRNSGQIAAALASYDKLRNERRMVPFSEASYGIQSRLARAELLAASNQTDAARKEALELVASLEAGEWPLSRESYKALDLDARKLAGMPEGSHAPEIKLAVAEMVEAAWDSWQIFQDPRSASRSRTEHMHRSEPVPVIAAVNANPERMVAAIYAGSALRHLGIDAAPPNEVQKVRAVLTDEHGRPLWGAPVDPSEAQVQRPLAAVDLPWGIKVAMSDGDAVFSRQRRTYLVVALTAIVLLVALACYAMARGVLREAAAGQLQSDFVSAVSHEFRSPLTSLRQLTELLAEGRINDESRRRRYFSVLQQETARLHQLVEDLLDFGRMDAGRRQYRLEPLDFSELVRDGIEDYQDHATANGHRIEVSAETGRLVVDADREALRRVVRNLLENAVKYSPDAKTVWVETGFEDHTAILRVRDEGIGIPPEEKARIFEKFVRGEAAKQACIPGTGVGLAMVKEIIRVHRGEIDLASEVGHGSTFMVRLPLSTQASGS